MRLHDFVDYHARMRPDAEFAVQGRRRMTYGQGASEINRLANALIASGLKPGDRIGVIAKNSIEYMLIYFGASKAGVVPVPLNYRLTPAEWAYILTDAQAKLVLAAPPFLDAVRPFRGDLREVQRWVALGDSGGSDWIDFHRWIADQPSTAPDLQIKSSDDAYQMYTSGTTGLPKGTAITHANITSNVLQLTHAFGALTGERCLTVAPLYHVASALIAFCTVCWGSSLFVQEDFVPSEVVRALSEERIGYSILVPVMIQACLLVPGVAEKPYPHLKHMLYGGSSIAEHTLRRALDVFKCDFAQGYGMTETGGVNCLLLPSDHRRALDEKPGLLLSAGRPTLGTDVLIVDADGEPVPPGTIGEILVRGPQVMRGYWHLPDATREALRGGWMHTGDAGIVDDEGYVFIQDRVKDLIISGGENIYPRDAEEVLFRHPAVADAAVIGVPDEKWGETVKAVVVLRQGHDATEDEILAFCQESLAGFKRPRSVDFVAQLPRNPSGKVLKRDLREPYWKGHSRRVGGS